MSTPTEDCSRIRPISIFFGAGPSCHASFNIARLQWLTDRYARTHARSHITHIYHTHPFSRNTYRTAPHRTTVHTILHLHRLFLILIRHHTGSWNKQGGEEGCRRLNGDWKVRLRRARDYWQCPIRVGIEGRMNVLCLAQGTWCRGWMELWLLSSYQVMPWPCRWAAVNGWRLTVDGWRLTSHLFCWCRKHFQLDANRVLIKAPRERRTFTAAADIHTYLRALYRHTHRHMRVSSKDGDNVTSQEWRSFIPVFPLSPALHHWVYRLSHPHQVHMLPFISLLTSSQLNSHESFLPSVLCTVGGGNNNNNGNGNGGNVNYHK